MAKKKSRRKKEPVNPNPPPRRKRFVSEDETEWVFPSQKKDAASKEKK